MKVIKPVFTILRNKYLVALIAFVVWMLFFDRNDFFEQRERRQHLYKLQESKEYFTNEIIKERKLSQELKNDPTVIEKIAREKYLMKRDDEDLFIIQPAEAAE
jgi:cell division protein DivIC